MVLTIGLTLILQPTPEALGLSAVFGALVGALKAYTRNLQTVEVLLPIATATLISALAFWLAPDTDDRRLDARPDPGARDVPARAAC